MLLLVFCSAGAKAGNTGYPGYNLQTFRPSVDGSGVINSVGTRGLQAGRVHQSVYLNYNRGLLRNSVIGFTGVGSNSIQHQIMGDFNFAVGLPGNFSAGVNLPVAFWQNGRSYKESSVGDIRFVSKWSILSQEKFSWLPLGIAVFGETYMPNGRSSMFTGSSEVMQSVMLSIDHEWDNLYAVVNFGHLFAPRDTFTVQPGVTQYHDDEYIFTTGFRVPFALGEESWAFLLDLQGRFLRENIQRRNFPVELISGVDGKLGGGLGVALGISSKITDAMGTPLNRYFLGLRWTSPGKKHDPASERITKEEAFSKILYYSFDSAQIQESEKPAVEEIAHWLKKNPRARVWVEGHTNGEGISSYNENLSHKRASGVASSLIAFGIEPDRLELAWYGMKHPVGDNETVDGRAKNRRVEVREITSK